jgi:hypothetical protein
MSFVFSIGLIVGLCFWHGEFKSTTNKAAKKETSELRKGTSYLPNAFFFLSPLAEKKRWSHHYIYNIHVLYLPSNQGTLKKTERPRTSAESVQKAPTHLPFPPFF